MYPVVISTFFDINATYVDEICSLSPSNENALYRKSIRLMITSRLSTGFDAFAAASAAAADLSSSWSDVGDVGE